ncbi:MAG: glycine cleavage system protein GcvH [Candidatus Latescibacterota bacterium]
MQFPDDRSYSVDHGWVKQENGVVRIGISDYAQSELGDIVYVDLPEIGRKVQKGGEYGTVESVKSVSALSMPVSGLVTKVNPALVDSPQSLNTSPYDNGWIIEITPENPDEFNSLMTARTYLAMLQGEK